MRRIKNWISYGRKEEREYSVRIFRESSGNLFHKCLGVIDGLLQPVQCPSKHERGGNQSEFYIGNHQSYGVNYQGVSDVWLRFLFFEVAVPGEYSDQVSIEATRFPDILASFPNMHYIIGDAAYLISSKIIIPFTGSQRNAVHNDSFNFHSSQIRIW